MTAPYNVLKKDAAGVMIWIEAVRDLEAAKGLAINLSRHNDGEFVVFDQQEQQVVASYKGTYSPPPARLQRLAAAKGLAEACGSRIHHSVR